MPAFQPEPFTEPEIFERLLVAVRRANKFLREQQESTFRVADDTGVERFRSTRHRFSRVVGWSPLIFLDGDSHGE